MNSNSSRKDPDAGRSPLRDPEETEKLEQQKKAARAPQNPAMEAPKPKPAETGKPLWDKPHSA